MHKRYHYICDAARRDAVNAALASYGWGPDNMVVPLVDSTGTVTHYGGSGLLTQGQISQALAYANAQGHPQYLHDNGTDFHAWIASLGLKVKPEPLP